MNATLFTFLPADLRVLLTRFLYDTHVFLYLPRRENDLFLHFLHFENAVGTLSMSSSHEIYNVLDYGEDAGRLCLRGDAFGLQRGETFLELERSVRMEVYRRAGSCMVAYFKGAFTREYRFRTTADEVARRLGGIHAEARQCIAMEFLRGHAAKTALRYPDPANFPQFVGGPKDYKIFHYHLDGETLIEPTQATYWLEAALGAGIDFIPGFGLRW